MADGYSSDGSYEENTPKQLRPTRRDNKNTINNSTPNGHSSGKQAKEKNNPEPRTFTVPEILCECQQKCTDRVTPPLIQKICVYFKGMPNRERQYDYLAKLILIKVRQINGDEKTAKGKPLRKMSFRYFVPVLSVEDMKKQIEERNLVDEWAKLQTEKEALNSEEIKVSPSNGIEKVKEDLPPKFADFPDWDHIEVCLNAFTVIHLISEKRVTITRATRKLQTDMKCSRPFAGYLQSGVGDNSAPTKKKVRLEDTGGFFDESSKQGQSMNADVSHLAAEWLAKQAIEAQPSFAINPKTLLPEGLILPASITCLPVFPRGGTSHSARDHNRDLDIVDSFFSDQLWKPEYIGGVP